MTTPIVPSISDEQLAELERLCESAIPGPWFSDSCDGSLYVSPEPNGDTAVAIVLPNDWNDEEGFWFSGPLTLACHELIGAANPQALSALISRLRAAEKDAGRYQYLKSRCDDGFIVELENHVFQSMWDQTIDQAMTEAKP